jgi:hypothetical protein
MLKKAKKIFKKLKFDFNKQIHPNDSSHPLSNNRSNIESYKEQLQNICLENSLSLKKNNNIDIDVYMKCFTHELRTPISTISLGLNLLKENESNENNLQTIKDIFKSVVFIEEILTKFANIQDGNITLNLYEPFSLKKLITTVEILILYNFKESNVNFECIIDNTVYDWNYGDAHNIKHIIINLLKNAIKYQNLSRKNRILINIKSEQNNTNNQVLFISICDTNDHLLPNIKKNLFKSFNSTSGSGMGLFICKKIIELHGGTINHNFIEPFGNEFIIKLPLTICKDTFLYNETPRDDNKESKKINHFLSNNKENKIYNLLIADDSSLNIKMMYKILEQYKIFQQIYTANDGLEILQQVNSNYNIDIIFLDKNMPNLDGVKTVKELRDNNYDKLIIGITGEELNDNSDFIKNGVNYIIQKPLTKINLDQIITFIKNNGTIIKENKKIVLVNNELKWI